MYNSTTTIFYEEDLNYLSFSQIIEDNEIITQKYVYDLIKDKCHAKRDFTEEESLNKKILSENRYLNSDVAFINLLDLISKDWCKINEDIDIYDTKEIVTNPEINNRDKNNKFKTSKKKERGKKPNPKNCLGKKHEKFDRVVFERKFWFVLLIL